MIGIEGTLMVPPERNQILGRPPWKPRYVTVARKEVPSKGSMSSSGQQSTTSTGLGRTRTFSEDFFLSIYKTKDESEPSHQYPIASITSCDIQSIAHRKQGSILPTLVVLISDKGKKRRSSRATGFMAGVKDNSSFTLLFRTPLEGNHPSLEDWMNVIRSARAPSSSLESPISPSFVNPFTTRSRDASDPFSPRPLSKGGLQHKSSNYTHSSRDPPTFSSESLSLRSRKSDVSSPSTHNNPTVNTNVYPAHPSYTSILPGDTPISPHGILADYPNDFIGGWTSAQGRSLRVIREPGRGSVGSAGPQSPTGEEPSSPAGPRETILDRAFQLRCIPGSETSVPGEEKLTSLARFDALMRGVEEKRQQDGGLARPTRVVESGTDEARHDSNSQHQPTFQANGSANHKEEDNDDDDYDDGDDDDNDDDDNDEYVHGHGPVMPATTQRALDYMASRRETVNAPRIPGARTPVSFYHVSSLTRPHTLTTPLRPHTSHARSRPSLSNQPRSYSHVSSHTTPGSPTTMPPSPFGSPPMPEDARSSNASSRAAGNNAANRASTNSQRLSFGEFTKRLSSTSSLILVQTNASNGSSNNSNRTSDLESAPQMTPGAKSPVDQAGSPRPPPPRTWEGDDRCGWRNTVMSAPEGGFV